MTFRWYRSRLFWSGLTGLVMLLVMWGTWQRSFLGASFTVSTGSFYVGKDSSTIMLGHRDFSDPVFSSSTVAMKTGFDWLMIDQGASHPIQVFAPLVRYQRFTGGLLLIGIWGIVASYMLVWYLALVWWLRRKHRLMNAGVAGYHGLPAERPELQGGGAGR